MAFIWNDESLAILRENAGILTTEQIAQLLHTNITAVRNMAYRLKLSLRVTAYNHRRIAQVQALYASETLSLKEIAAKTGLTASTVQYIVYVKSKNKPYATTEYVSFETENAVHYRVQKDFVLIVKGTKAQAEAIREECRGVLEGSLKLRLNMDKTKITHVNDGFIFLGHRIIRKRSRYGEMRVVSTIPQEKARNFAASLTALLSGNYSESKVDMAEQLNRKLKGWAMFYQFVDFKAKVFSYIDRVVFWKLAHWLARKYRTGIASLMRWWCKSPKPGQSKTWVLFGKTNHGKLSGEILYWLVGQGKKLFRWRLPEGNPYLRTETRNTYTSRFTEVAMAFASI